jgi:hypothetical protein
MCKLVMKFDSSQDFIRAYEHFQNDSKFGNAEFSHSDMSIKFECKNGNGAETRKRNIEEEIMGLSFEYESFEVID